VTAQTPIGAQWRELRLECELAAHYHQPYSLIGLGRTFRSPIVDAILPGALHVRMIGLLDEAVRGEYKRQALREPKHLKQYRSKLERQIRHLAEIDLIKNLDALIAALARRRAVAHEPFQRMSWEQLIADIQAVESALIALGVARSPGHLEFYAERGAARSSNDPKAIAETDYRFGVSENGRMAIEVKFTERLMKDSE
jgi:hypothetical protein